MATKKAKGKQKLKFGKEVDALYALGLRVGQEQDKVNKLVAQYDVEELRLKEKMDKEGVVSVKGSRGLAYFSETVVPTVEDWDKALKWIVKHKAYDLFTRKVNSAGWRGRLIGSNSGVPGVVSFTRRTLHCKKAG